MTDPSPPEEKKKKPTRRKDWATLLSPEDAHIAMGLKTAGWSSFKIQKAMRRSNTAIDRSLRRIPDAQERIDDMRARVRLDKMTHSVDVDALLWTRLKKDVPTADAKDVDALFRSAYANEKIQANLVGQAVKVDVTHAGIQPNVELNQLLVQLGADGLRELTGG